jgi:hypothetical protein
MLSIARIRGLWLCVLCAALIAGCLERDGEDDNEGGLAKRNREVRPEVVQSAPTGTTTATPLPSSGFATQTHLGFDAGDQWEPSIAADAGGHIYVLYPQYGGVPKCTNCGSPTMILLVSADRGSTWSAPAPIATTGTGQWDAQITVDPVDGKTVYAAWLQNNKSDIVVAKSSDFGATWSTIIAESSNAGMDKPILAVRGPNVYLAYNHTQHAWFSSSHDGAKTFSTTYIGTSHYGWSLAGGGTVTPNGNVYFSWAGYSQNGGAKGPVTLYVTASADGGNTWSSTVLDTSGSPPDCSANFCGWAYLGAQMAMASDASGTLYVLWNAGPLSPGGAPERIYFSTSTDGAQTWSPRLDVSLAPAGIQHAFPAIVARGMGDVRIAWMDARALHGVTPVWNVYYRTSSDSGASWSGESVLSSYVPRYSYIFAEGYSFPFGDYFEIDIDDKGTTHAVFGEGASYDSPGSIWYTRGN